MEDNTVLRQRVMEVLQGSANELKRPHVDIKLNQHMIIVHRVVSRPNSQRKGIASHYAGSRGVQIEEAEAWVHRFLHNLADVYGLFGLFMMYGEPACDQPVGLNSFQL